MWLPKRNRGKLVVAVQNCFALCNSAWPIILIVCSCCVGQTPEIVPQADTGFRPSVLAWGPQDRWVAALDNRHGHLRIYDSPAGHLVKQIPLDIGSSGDATDIVAHPALDQLALRTAQSIVLYDVQTGQKILTADNSQRCFSLCFSKDHYLSGICSPSSRSAKSHRVFRTWSMHDGTQLMERPVEDKFANIGPTSEGNVWLGTSKYSDFLLWDYHTYAITEMATGREVGHGRGELQAISSKARTAVVRSSDLNISLVNVSTGKRVKHLASRDSSALVSSDGSFYLVRLDDAIALVDAHTGASTQFHETAQSTAQIALSPSNKWIAIAEGDAILLVDVANAARIHMLSAPTVLTSTASIHGEREENASTLHPPSAAPAIAALIGDNRMLAVLSTDFYWNVWEIASGTHLPFKKPLVSRSSVESLSPTSVEWLDRYELGDIERSLTGNDKRWPKHELRASGGIMCRSRNGNFAIHVTMEGNFVTSAFLISVTGGREDLVKEGVVFNSLDRPAGLDHGGSFCSLSPDGSRLILRDVDDQQKPEAVPLAQHGTESDATKGSYSAASLVVYDSTNGTKLCELEDSNSLNLRAGEVSYTADGKYILIGNIDEFSGTKPNRFYNGPTWYRDSH